MDEPCPVGRGEGYAARDDEVPRHEGFLQPEVISKLSNKKDWVANGHPVLFI